MRNFSFWINKTTIQFINIRPLSLPSENQKICIKMLLKAPATGPIHVRSSLLFSFLFPLTDISVKCEWNISCNVCSHVHHLRLIQRWMCNIYVQCTHMSWNEWIASLRKNEKTKKEKRRSVWKTKFLSAIKCVRIYRVRCSATGEGGTILVSSRNLHSCICVTHTHDKAKKKDRCSDMFYKFCRKLISHTFDSTEFYRFVMEECGEAGPKFSFYQMEKSKKSFVRHRFHKINKNVFLAVEHNHNERRHLILFTFQKHRSYRYLSHVICIWRARAQLNDAQPNRHKNRNIWLWKLITIADGVASA